MSFDHGELNVPLSKRGNIDRDIDRHKAEQAAKRKADAARHAAIRAEKAAAKRECLEIIKGLSNEHIEAFSKRLNVPKRSVRAWLRMAVGHAPRTALANIKNEIGAQP